jgi:4-amino-4-deoxy-L-arabinose transferase-like glycosyltransferase
MLQHTLRDWRDRPFWLLLFLSLVVLFCVYRIALPSPVFINLGTEGDERYLRNFHFGEQSELYPFRWTKDSSYIEIPNLGSLPLEIILGADAPRPEGQPSPRVSLIANGTVLADFTMQNELLAYRFLYHPPLISLPRDLLLEIQSDTFAPPGDASRALGIILNTVEVKPVSSPFRLFQASLMASLIGALSIAFSYLLLRWLGVSQKKSLACGVIALALLGFGIARQFIVARFLIGFSGLLVMGYVLAIPLEARGYREPLIAQLGRPWKALKTWVRNLASVIRDPSRLFARLNSFWLRWRVDLLISAGLLIAAIAIRRPYLMLIPPLSDEHANVKLALALFKGEESFLIIGSDAYFGPVQEYLIAFAFRLFGVSIFLPRVYMMVMGALTVVLTYWLAREMSNRTAGLVAAALMATSPMHILINSHVAWSSCITPFFTTLMLLAFYAGVRRNSGPLLALSGFLAGLALQTHPAVLVLFPGMLVWFLGRRDLRKWLKQPWPYLAVALALLAYGNMIWYNAHGRIHSLAAYRRRRNQYTGNPSLSEYMTNFQDLLLMLLCMVSGTLESQNPPGFPIRVRFDVPFIVYGVLLLAGLLYASARGKSLPSVVVASTALLMPYFNKDYDLPIQSRYIAFLLPPAYAAMGALLADVLHLPFQWRRRQMAPLFSTFLRAILPLTTIVICLVIVVYPLQPLFTYYYTAMENGRSNQAILDIVNRITQEDSEAFVYVDNDLKRFRLLIGSNVRKAFDYLLILEDRPHEVVKPLETELQLGSLAILTEENYLLLNHSFRLSPVGFDPSYTLPPHAGYGLYWVEGKR